MEMRMVIEDTDPKQYGTSFVDLALFLQTRAAGSRPLTMVLQPACSCGTDSFYLEADPCEECARRTCPDCGSESFLCESKELWPYAGTDPVVCHCGETLFEIGVGFATRTDGEIARVIVGRRCVQCGGLGVAVDSQIDGAPSDHLFRMI